MEDENGAYASSGAGEVKRLNFEFNRCRVRSEDDGLDTSMKVGLKQGDKWNSLVHCARRIVWWSFWCLLEDISWQLIGRSNMFIDPSDFSFHRCSSDKIIYAFFTDQLYVSVGKEIFKCPFKFTPRIRIATE